MARKKNIQDPFASREAQRYDQPIASREHILATLKQHAKPCKFTELVKILGFSKSEYEQNALERRLAAMVRDGQLDFNRRDGYSTINERDLIRGRVIANPDGYGFLHVENGGQDLFIPGRQMRSLLHGDLALMRVVGTDRRGRREAALIEVIERANLTLVGRLFCEGQVSFVVADNKRIHQDIIITKENLGKAREGQIVLVDIIEQPTGHHPPLGKIVEVLGEHMAPGMEIDIAINSHNIPNQWPDAVLKTTKDIDKKFPIKNSDERLDIRHLPLVTIDGEDAQDFDDAVYCETKKSGWKLYVAIADVSHYVIQDSALDKEAYHRGTSVYFSDRVIPMLPEILSNELCSLRPGVDRLCMLCILHFDTSGAIQKFEFKEAIMRSHARLTYTVVDEILNLQSQSAIKKHQDLVPHLKNLHQLFKVLSKQRKQRGAIDLDTIDTKIVFGKDKKIDNIVPVVRNDAHRLIEECMIAANIAAAHFLNKHKILGLYRVHEPPPADKLEDLITFLHELGVSFPKVKTVQAKHYAKLLSQIRERPDFHMIQTVVLRSLSQAEYKMVNYGHFGLSLEHYTHFTSPIRRYPDLIVHRAIRHILRGGAAKNYSYTKEHMLSIGEHSSMAERRADDASRDALEWLKCEYMLDKVGDSYEGIVTGVTSFGFFVELQDIYVEGLVHITVLPKDYYQFDPVAHKLVGERSGRTFQLGDSVKVVVTRVSLDDRQIDFDIADANKKKKKNRKRK